MVKIKHDGSIVFSTKVDSSGFNQGIKNMPSALNGLKGALTKLGTTIGITFSVGAIIRFGKEAINLASNLVEVQNVVDTAFGSMKYKMEDLAKTSIKALGMSELSVKQFASTYMAMGRGMGLSLETASNMAIETTKRVGDVASFYNKNLSEVDTMMKSIWTGETESLRQIGVVMTEANLQAFAYSKGIHQNIADLDQATKTQLRYAYVMEQTALAQGDFEKTSGSWANQTRILKEQLDAVKANLGAGLIQAFTPALRTLNNILGALVNISAKFREITAELFGEQDVSQKPAQQAIDSVNGLSDAQDKLAQSTEKANKASKRSLASFDELYRLGSNEDEKQNSGAGNLSGSLGTLDINTKPAQDSANKLSSAADRLKDKFKEFASWVNTEPWHNGFDNLKETGKKLGEIISTALENSKPKVKNALTSIQNMFKTGIYVCSTIWGEGFETITENLKNWVNENAEEIGKAIEGTIGIISDSFSLIADIISDLFKIALDYWNEYGRPIVDRVHEAVLDIKTYLLELYNEIVVPTFDRMLKWVRKIWDESLKGVIEEFMGFVGRINELILDLYDAKIKPKIDWLMEYVVPHIKIAIDAIVDIFFACVQYITDSAKNLLSVLNGLIDFISGVLTGDWDKAWKGLQKIFDSFKNQIKSTLDTLKSIFSSAFTAIKKSVTKIFTDLWNAVKNKINSMLSGIEAMLNRIVARVNDLIYDLNKLHVDVPDILGGGHIGFDIPYLTQVKIPKLARGAVIPPNREFLAVLGDQKNGRNLEVPEDVIRQIVREEAGEREFSIEKIEIYLTNKMFSEAFIKYHNGVVKRTGVSPLKLKGV